MRVLEVLLLMVAGVPLLVYPFATLAFTMSLAVIQNANTSTLVTVFAIVCIAAMTLYPIVYVYSVIMYRVHRKKGRLKKSKASVWLPYKFIAIIIATFFLWNAAEGVGA